MKPTSHSLPILIVFFILGNLQLSSQNIEQGLIAHYLFSGNTADSSTFGNHGTGYNIVLTEDRFGTPDAAYDFNGLNAYITIPNSASLQSPTNEITQVAWINMYGYSLTGFVFSPVFMKSNSGSNAFQYRMYISPSGLGASFNNWTNTGVNYTEFNAFEWYMITTTLKEDTIRTYINDGYLGYAVVNGNMVVDNRPLEIGRDVPGVTEHFYGKLDDMRIYDRALTPEEVELLYTPGTVGKDLDLKVFLEGPFHGSVMDTDLNIEGLLPLSQPFNQSPWNYPGVESVAAIPNGLVVDWVLVEYRIAPNAASAYSITTVARKAAFILDDGSIVDLDGVSKLRYNGIVNNNLFVVIFHRNHMGVLSANPLADAPTAYVYDFTDSQAKAYGGLAGQKELATGIYGMYGGNTDGNNQIDLIDITTYWYGFAGYYGYHSSDFNMDGQSNNNDKNDVWYSSHSVTSQLP